LFYVVQQFSLRTAAYCQGQYYHILVNPIVHDDPRQSISAALSSVVKRPGREADYSLPSIADDWMYIYIFCPWFSWFEKCKLDL
jgi:hypothetical protein